MIDLAPEHARIVHEILRRRVPRAEVWIFGSRCRGTAKPHSDLDLAILAGAPLDGMLLAEIEEDFSESELPFRVDVVDWSAAGEEFQEMIRDAHAILKAPE